MTLATIPKSFLICFAAAISFFMIATPVLGYAATAATSPDFVDVDEQYPKDACSDAEAQAIADTDSTIWLVAGCLGGVLTLLAAQVLEPNPPATALLGQSEEYVAEYTDCYQDQAKKVRTKKAVTGCLVGAAAYGLIYAIAAAAAVSELD